MFLDGSDAGDLYEQFYVAFNAHHERVEFTVPAELGRRWRVVLHTNEVTVNPVPTRHRIAFSVEAYSLIVLARLPDL